MSYPSQPQYTPPYGQPPQRQGNNLWLIGGSVIAVLAIVMTVTLMIVQQTAGSNEAGGGGETEDPTEEVTEEPTQEETTEDDSGGDDSGGDDSGGGEASGYDEATCDAYDLAPIEELFGEPADHPGGTTISADSYDNGGYLSCSYTTNDYDSLTVTASGYGSADSVLSSHESDREFWEEDEDYDVSDFTEVGETGYHYVFGDSISQKRQISFVVGKVVFTVNVWIYPDEHDVDKADEVLTDFGQQAADLFADHT